MNKIASYKDAIYKEAASAMAGDIVPSDYSKVKQIELNPDEFRTINSRNMRFHEKIGEGAKNTAKNAKKVAKNIKGASKLQKAMLGTMAAGAVLGTTALGGEAKALLHNPDKKKDTRADKSRDKDTETRIFRDGVNPELKRDMAILPTKTILNAAMLTPTAKLMRKGGIAGAKLGKKLSGGDSRGVLIGNAVGTIAGASLAATPVALHDALLISHQEIKELDRLKKRYFNKGITKKEKKDIIKANMKDKLIPVQNHDKVKPDSIEEKIQRRRREKAKRDLNKSASVCLDEMHKEASEKWTKQDKKGYAKNVAIGVAQDFMNAGNPLNVGSSIVGSVLDSALLEKGSININKKLKANKISQKQADGYNKAVEIKNGIALPHAAMKTK